MSSSSAAAPGPEGRARQVLRKVFGFQAFKTALQESATMAVVRGEQGQRCSEEPWPQPSEVAAVAELQWKLAERGFALPALLRVWFGRTWLHQTRYG